MPSATEKDPKRKICPTSHFILWLRPGWHSSVILCTSNYRMLYHLTSYLINVRRLYELMRICLQSVFQLPDSEQISASGRRWQLWKYWKMPATVYVNRILVLRMHFDISRVSWKELWSYQPAFLNVGMQCRCKMIKSLWTCWSIKLEILQLVTKTKIHNLFSHLYSLYLGK